MSDENKSYQVTDRRHSSVVESSDEAARASDERPLTDSATVADRPAEPMEQEPPVNLTTFVVSLAAQAGMLLGGAPGEAPDLKGARWIISILEMLQEKTEGRRTAGETEALDRILYELRMGYVERARAGGA